MRLLAGSYQTFELLECIPRTTVRGGVDHIPSGASAPTADVIAHELGVDLAFVTH
jgi:hypothetical protein